MKHTKPKLLGTVSETRQNIEEVFGKPDFSDWLWRKEISIIWNIVFEDGTFAILHDWKAQEELDRNYTKLPLNRMYDFRVSGADERAVQLIQELLEEHRDLKASVKRAKTKSKVTHRLDRLTKQVEELQERLQQLQSQNTGETE